MEKEFLPFGYVTHLHMAFSLRVAGTGLHCDKGGNSACYNLLVDSFNQKTFI